MNIYLIWYVQIAAFFGIYMLGLFHGQQKTDWRYAVVATLTGAIWPIFVLYGAVIQFNEKP